jgi:DNA-binding MarR family transcriptional regulator
LEGALGYFDGAHEKLKGFLELFEKVLKQQKATLREAKIVAALYDKKEATKQELSDVLYDSSSATKNRVINKLVEEGTVTDA